MWENLTHIGVDIQTKEHLKEDYKFSQVPFCLVINKVITVYVHILLLVYTL